MWEKMTEAERRILRLAVGLMTSRIQHIEDLSKEETFAANSGHGDGVDRVADRSDAPALRDNIRDRRR